MELAKLSVSVDKLALNKTEIRPSDCPFGETVVLLEEDEEEEGEE